MKTQKEKTFSEINNIIAAQKMFLFNIETERLQENYNIGVLRDLIDEHIKTLLKQQLELKKAVKIVSKYARLTVEDKENIITDAIRQMESGLGLNVKILAKKYNCSYATIYNVINKYSKQGIRKT
jgi:Mor family transcriptional regulator